jgi:hypothetical protein
VMCEANVIPLLIGCGFRASFPLASAWAATRLASRFPAANRHFIWACAIVMALLLPLAAIVIPRWSVATPAPVARLASIAHQQATTSRVPTIAPGELLGANAIGKPEDSSPSGLKPRTIATWIWITGAVIVFSYALFGHFAAWRLYRTTRKVSGWLSRQDLVSVCMSLSPQQYQLPLCCTSFARSSLCLRLHVDGPRPAFALFCCMNLRTSNATTSTLKLLLSLLAQFTGSILSSGSQLINCALSVNGRATTLYSSAERAERITQQIFWK